MRPIVQLPRHVGPYPDAEHPKHVGAKASSVNTSYQFLQVDFRLVPFLWMAALSNAILLNASLTLQTMYRFPDRPSIYVKECGKFVDVRGSLLFFPSVKDRKEDKHLEFSDVEPAAELLHQYSPFLPV